MAKKKVYAVKKGKQTGLFYSWDACKESVIGYPGAEYQGFETERSEERRVGKECNLSCRSRWSPYH